jgi:hypothetical protein
MTIRKIKFNQSELDGIRHQFGDYLWAVVDTRRGVITIGDETLAELRDFLLVKRSKPEDIFCTGFDLKTGEIFYPPLSNRRNPYVDKNGIPEIIRNRIETLFHYFFEEIPAYQEEKNRPRYTKEPSAYSFC